jgi:hypothetical protein
MTAKRTTHRSSKGTKHYTYKSAHGQDIKRKSRAEGVSKRSLSELRETAERFSKAMGRLAKR